jgi:diguanylate cyclase (GGDEF)-like protein
VTSDLRFFLSAISIIAFLQAVAFVIARRSNRTNTSLGWWCVGLVLIGLGNGGLALRGLIPDALSIIVANTLLVASYVPIYAGLRKMRGMPVPTVDGFGWAITLAVAVAMGWFSMVVHDLAVRIIALQLAATVLTGRIAMEVGVHSRGPLGTPATQILTALWWFLCIMSAITVIMTASQGERTQDFLQAGPPTSVFLAVAPLLALAIPLVVLWMESQSKQHSAGDLLSEYRHRAAIGLQAFLIHCDGAILGGQLPVSVMAIDLDNFKQLSRQHGFVAARAMVDWTERLIRQHMRETDSLELAGLDHFLLLMPETDQDTALIIGENIRREVELGTFLFEKHGLQTTVSIGVVMQTPSRMTGKALHIATKLATDSARAAGRNRVELAPQTFGAIDPIAF